SPEPARCDGDESVPSQLPRMLGLTELDGCPMLVRRLAPQEDKLNLTRLQPADLDPLAVYLGGLLGRAHRRGATVPVTAAWSFRERERLIEKAIVLAGIHESAYLAWCRSGVA
ncbi:MAG TPA: DUF2252 family protein, partial [Polyangiaceae bacterium]